MRAHHSMVSVMACSAAVQSPPAHVGSPPDAARTSSTSSEQLLVASTCSSVTPAPAAASSSAVSFMPESSAFRTWYASTAASASAAALAAASASSDFSFASARAFSCASARMRLMSSPLTSSASSAASIAAWFTPSFSALWWSCRIFIGESSSRSSACVGELSVTGVCVGDFFFGEEKPSAEDGEPSPLAADIFAERSSILDGECSRTSFVLARTERRSATPQK